MHAACGKLKKLRSGRDESLTLKEWCRSKLLSLHLSIVCAAQKEAEMWATSRPFILQGQMSVTRFFSAGERAMRGGRTQNSPCVGLMTQHQKWKKLSSATGGPQGARNTGRLCKFLNFTPNYTHARRLFTHTCTYFAASKEKHLYSCYSLEHGLFLCRHSAWKPVITFHICQI